MPNCEHSWCTPGSAPTLAHIFEDWQGLIRGLALCRHCGAPALLELLAWRGRNLNERIYSIGVLPRSATEVFIRNMQSAYCDVTRYANEIDALTHMGQVEQIGWFQLPEYVCQAVITAPKPLPHKNWRDIDPKDDTWWHEFE